MFSEPCTLREPAYAALDRIGVPYRIVAESSDLSGLYAAVRSGLGVALLPIIGRLPDGLCLAEGLPRAVAHRCSCEAGPASTPTS